MKTILVSAYGCEPGKGSEQGVGWHWVLEMAHLANLVVFTRSNNRAAIEAALPADLASRISFVYYDLPARVRRLKRKERGLYFYYCLWQWGVYRCARRLVTQRRVDYVMHLTFGSIWMPTFMHRLPIPFIWGPVGGCEAVPWPLIRTLPVKGRVIEYLRYFLMATLGLNPLVTGIFRRSRVILTRTNDTARAIPARYADKVKTVLETGVADEWLGRPVDRAGSAPGAAIKVIYTGRLVALKNVAMAIKGLAIARQRGTNIELTIVGDGPLKPDLVDLAAQLGVSDHVRFAGLLAQSAVLDSLGGSDIYLFPSLKEGGVWSLIEAMALSLPVVCVNSSGMAVITDDESAVRVEPGDPHEMTVSFADALVSLASSAEKRQALGARGRQRIDCHFRWQHKRDFMAGLLAGLEKGQE